jgi:phytoene dehydrogenase-like protein
LNLPKHGLDLIPLESTFTPLPDGSSLFRGADAGETRREIARFSQRDADVYPSFGMAMSQVGRLVRPILEMTPPDPASMNPRALLDVLRIGRLAGTMDTDERALHYRMLTLSAIDFLDRWFESPILKASMSISGIIGTFQGVRSPGTAYVLLHHYMGDLDGAFRAWGLSRGGTGAISVAIADAARSFGADIVTEAPVASVAIRGGRVKGVVLEDGRELRASTVVSGLDPHRTFLRLVGASHLPDEFVDDIRRFRMRGSSGKVNLALDGLPDFTSRPGNGPHLRGDITIAPSIPYLERAFDDAKRGAFSRRPFMDIVIPTLSDPTVAPPGKHVMSIFVQYAPYHLTEGPDAWPAQREAFGDAVIATLAEYCPNLPDIIRHRQVLTPWDLEQTFGLTEGNIFHGELGLEQLFFQRPAPGWARYRTPIRGLWMCGSGTHPGGGIMGAPGRNAARTILGGRLP